MAKIELEKMSDAELYRNPDNPAQTWTGKGARPGWFVAAQERGISREEMLI